jgi:hypothetical protein
MKAQEVMEKIRGKKVQKYRQTETEMEIMFDDGMVLSVTLDNDFDVMWLVIDVQNENDKGWLI